MNPPIFQWYEPEDRKTVRGSKYVYIALVECYHVNGNLLFIRRYVREQMMEMFPEPSTRIPFGEVANPA